MKRNRLKGRGLVKSKGVTTMRTQCASENRSNGPKDPPSSFSKGAKEKDKTEAEEILESEAMAGMYKPIKDPSYANFQRGITPLEKLGQDPPSGKIKWYVPDPNKESKFVICTIVGGVMECPEFSYHNPETIYAKTLQEACRIYREMHNVTYWNVGRYPVGVCRCCGKV